MGQTPPHLKEFFLGGSKICRQASCFACGDAKLQHLRDLQPIVFSRESIQGHGPTIAEPCIPYRGGGGGGPPPIKQKLGLGAGILMGIQTGTIILTTAHMISDAPELVFAQAHHILRRHVLAEVDDA